MNMKTMALVGLCVMPAALAMTPAAEAEASVVQTAVCVTSVADFTVSSGSCGANNDSWVTIVDDWGGCHTSNIFHLGSGC